MIVPESDSNTVYGQSELASPRLIEITQRAISAVGHVKVETNLEYNRLRTQETTSNDITDSVL